MAPRSQPMMFQANAFASVSYTHLYRDEIVEQLENNCGLRRLKYCDLSLALDNMAWGARCPKQGYRKNEDAVIPKKIHCVWFSKNPMPYQFQKNIDNWKALCSDYEICFWNEENYDISQNPYMYNAYQNEKWSFVSDYARLDIIYRNGGIYFDTCLLYTSRCV